MRSDRRGERALTGKADVITSTPTPPLTELSPSESLARKESRGIRGL